MGNDMQYYAQKEAENFFKKIDFSFLPANMQEKSMYLIAGKYFSYLLIKNGYEMNYDYSNANPNMLVNLHDFNMIVGTGLTTNIVKQNFINLCKENPSLYFHLSSLEQKDMHVFNEGREFLDNAEKNAQKLWNSFHGKETEEILPEASQLQYIDFLRQSTWEEFEIELNKAPNAIKYVDCDKNTLLHLLCQKETNEFNEKFILLFMAGALENLEAKNRASLTPLDYFHKRNHDEETRNYINNIIDEFQADKEKALLENTLSLDKAKKKIKI